MKALKYSLIILLVLFISNACNKDNLDLKPLGDTEADIFDEQIDFDRAVLAAYAKIADLFVYGGSNGDHHSFFLLPGDDITTTNSGGSQPFEIFSTLQPGNGFLNRDYDIVYLLVNRANVLLEKIAMDEERDESAYSNTAIRDQNKGEAYFLRGWAFFLLWNYFGTAPLVTYRINTQDQINPPEFRWDRTAGSGHCRFYGSRQSAAGILGCDQYRPCQQECCQWIPGESPGI